MGRTRSKTFLWVLSDTGSAVTCMNRPSLETAFGKKLKTATDQKECYKIEVWIKGRKCTHTVKIMNELSENILGVDFIQKHRLNYNSKSK